jgi:hypothetical protein
VAKAGPYTGKTYREKWGAEANLDRLSAYNRDVMQFDAGLSYRLAPKSLLSLEYRYKNINRDYFEVTEAGDTETTINRIKASMSSRLSKVTRLNASFIYEDIDQPFIGVNAAGTVSFNPAPQSSPLAPGSIQYFQLYANRIVDLSNQPNQTMQFKANLSHKLSKTFSVNGSVNWKTSENDILDYSKWNKDHLALNASAWFALSPEFYGTISYSYGDDTTETLFILPIFDG